MDNLEFVLIRYLGPEFSYHTYYDKYEIEVADAKLEYSPRRNKLVWPVSILGHDGTVSDEVEEQAVEFIEAVGKRRFAQALADAKAKWCMEQWGFSGSHTVTLWRVTVTQEVIG